MQLRQQLVQDPLRLTFRLISGLGSPYHLGRLMMEAAERVEGGVRRQELTVGLATMRAVDCYL